jgi:hypothetical protein
MGWKKLTQQHDTFIVSEQPQGSHHVHGYSSAFAKFSRRRPSDVVDRRQMTCQTVMTVTTYVQPQPADVRRQKSKKYRYSVSHLQRRRRRGGRRRRRFPRRRRRFLE